MPPWTIRLGRVLLVLALGGWVTGVLLLSSDADTSLRAAVLDRAALRAAVAGLLVGLPIGGLLSWLRPPVWLGPITGAVASLAGIWTYFYLWPHEWQPTRWEAWKSVATVVGVYWAWLLPGAVVAGLLAHAWCRMDLRQAAWQLVEDTMESPTRGDRDAG